MSNRVDLPHVITQEPDGPVRMCSIFTNEAVKRNEERIETEIYHLNSESRVTEKVTKHMSVFTRGDLVRAVKCIPDHEVRERLLSGDDLQTSPVGRCGMFKVFFKSLIVAISITSIDNHQSGANPLLWQGWVY